MKYSKLSVVIPAYNEEKTIEQIVEKVASVDFKIDLEIVVVDDCSADSTPKILEKISKKYNLISIRNEINLGKSKSVAKGIENTSGDLVVVQDADLELNPNDLLKFVELFQNQDVDVIYGNRLSNNNKYLYKQNYIGGMFLSLVTNIFTYPRIRTYIPDMTVCYKMVSGNIYRELSKKLINEYRFGFEPEITIRLARYKKDGRSLKFKVLNIEYNPRSKEEGKHLNAVKDGFETLVTIIKSNFYKQ